MPTKSSRPVPVAGRVNRFSYAIRNIVAEAKAVEARGQHVRYLNIGDPVAFGFKTPAHLVETVAKAVRDGHNGYVPSAGIPSAREAVAADYTARGIATPPDRVLITTGTSEGIELALNALVDEGDEVLVPSPTYPLYTAVLAKIAAQPRYYATDPEHDWLPDLDHLRTLVTAADPRARGDRSEQSDRRGVPGAGPTRADRLRRATRPHDSGGRGLWRPGIRGSNPVHGDLRSRRADHLVLESVEGVSRTRLAGRMARRRSKPQTRRCAGRDEETRGRPVVQSGTDAIRRGGGADR